ncbi:MAG: GPR1/FUN34/YaaH family transporter [Actinomycetota bacterium]|nr:GPR1/FUN34/YaaH family transporter [Actinomycetota bacterium]
MTDKPNIGDAHAATRIFLRPIASPLALGFLALGGATLLLSGSQLGWFAPRETFYVALALIAFGAPLQLLCCIFGFLARDPAAATGMGVLAASWLTIGLIKLNSTPAATSTVLGVFLVFAGLALLVPAIGAAFGKLVPAIVLLTAAARFFLTGLYQLSANPSLQYAAGVVGLVLLGVALYAALALEIEDAWRKTVLPVLRVGAGKTAVEGSVEDQIEGAGHEAGVREQL